MSDVKVLDKCIAVGSDAGKCFEVDRSIEVNFAGIGLRRTVMTEEEWPHVRAVVLRMFHGDMEREAAIGRLIDTLCSTAGKRDE